MYLHLGNNVSVFYKNVIAILDIENSSTSKITKEYLANAGKSGWVVTCSYDMPKSFVVTLDENFSERVFISSISSYTLKKRYENITNGII